MFSYCHCAKFSFSGVTAYRTMQNLKRNKKEILEANPQSKPSPLSDQYSDISDVLEYTLLQEKTYR